MEWFYLVAGLLALAVAILIARPLLSGAGDDPGRDALDVEVFRDQLAEIERERERGTISPAEAEGARVEISRRLLAASARARQAEKSVAAPPVSTGLVAGLAILGVPAVAAILYLIEGAPTLPDNPLAGRATEIAAATSGNPHAGVRRPTQAEMEAQVAADSAGTTGSQDPEYDTLIQTLQQRLEERPDDLQGQRLLANGLMRQERYAEAWPIYAGIVEVLGDDADAELMASQVEGMVLAAGGYVSPETERVIGATLLKDPKEPVARLYSGLGLAQGGAVGEAVAVWESLAADSTPADPWMQWLNQLLEQARALQGGVPPVAGVIPNPTEEEVAAANAMSPEERAEMINGMVDSLAERLDTEGGSAQEWGRLMNSYMQLGRTDEASAAYERALAAYPEGADNAALRDFAIRIGLAVAVEDILPDLGPAPGAPGPTAEDMAAASEMSPEDRADMVAGMVARLEDRLLTTGGTGEEWYRLMFSYNQLGREEDALRVYNLSQEKLKGQDAGFMKQEALLLGIITQ